MNLGIYVHVPYCVRKCNYCDFVSAPLAGREHTVAPYFEELGSQVRRAGQLYGSHFAVDTVFFGGGTPSIVDADHICGLLQTIKESFPAALDPEVTLEVNPGTLTEEKLQAYRRAGFNRLSMGVQSLDDRVLGLMGRIHDSKEALRSFRLARNYFDNINLDLMMGVPGQTLQSWQDTLSRTLDLEPDHLSFYSLQLEEGTPFYKDYRAGRLELPSWEENRAMYHLALEKLAAGGFHHYEVSNAAKPGRECRHNLKYWNMDPYLGFGSAAHSFLGGRRFEDGAFPLLPKEDIPRAADLSKAFQWAPESLSAELKGDLLFTALRLLDGLDLDRYKELFGSAFDDDFGREASLLQDEKLLERKGSFLTFTAAGLDQTNVVLERLLNTEN